jgi:hypothetical protein
VKAYIFSLLIIIILTFLIIIIVDHSHHQMLQLKLIRVLGLPGGVGSAATGTWL